VVGESGGGDLFALSHGHLALFAASGKPVSDPFAAFSVHGEVAVTQAYDNIPADQLIDTPLASN